MATAISNPPAPRPRRNPHSPPRCPAPAPRIACGLILAAAAVCGSAPDAPPQNAVPTAEAAAVKRAHEARAQAEQRFLGQPHQPVLAWQWARACFDCADLASNQTQRAQMAHAGMRAASRAIALDAKQAAAFYYLGLNQGQLARTRKLTALGLVKDMERAWLQAIALDPTFDFAGPHRSLGMLYRDAPGWPWSLGNRAKARHHLEKALSLAPDYPDNLLCLLESNLAWNNLWAVRQQLASAEQTLARARRTLAGEAWAWSWHDWDRRWKAIRAKAAAPPKTG
ncbi:MAG: hypothetical protein JXQ71_15365 [Verrucomicrobia bacterium]|nr:hypothetical protein [Verrucomicrobiota bacterium]